MNRCRRIADELPAIEVGGESGNERSACETLLRKIWNLPPYVGQYTGERFRVAARLNIQGGSAGPLPGDSKKLHANGHTCIVAGVASVGEAVATQRRGARAR
jgi:hypothetical protein